MGTGLSTIDICEEFKGIFNDKEVTVQYFKLDENKTNSVLHTAVTEGKRKVVMLVHGVISDYGFEIGLGENSKFLWYGPEKEEPVNKFPPIASVTLLKEE